MEHISAASLMRNDKVILADDEMPFLVDTVDDLTNGGVRVTFSSGDVKEYGPEDQVLVK